jgi:hypothetical protein
MQEWRMIERKALMFLKKELKELKEADIEVAINAIVI